MKEFMLLFRYSPHDLSHKSPEEMEAYVNKWKEWGESIAVQGKLAKQPQRLPAEGKVLRAGGVVTDGPFVEIKEQLGGFLVVKAENLDEATTLAHGCPVLEVSGSVEIRPLFE